MEPAREARVFVALVPPAALRAELARRAAPALGPRFRATRASEVHLTLRFLGALARGELERVARALERGVGALRGGEPVELRVRGVGAFPGAGRARVLWAGVHEPEPARGRLARLHEALRDALGSPGAGETAEAPFHPHLTLARSREPTGARAPAAFAALELDLAWRATELLALESLPGAPPADAPFGRYRPFARAPLPS